MRSQDSDSGEKARVFKLNANPGEPILLERCVSRSKRPFSRPHPSSTAFTLTTLWHHRQGGHERQFRFHCPRCTLPIGESLVGPISLVAILTEIWWVQSLYSFAFRIPVNSAPCQIGVVSLHSLRRPDADARTSSRGRV